MRMERNGEKGYDEAILKNKQVDLSICNMFGKFGTNYQQVNKFLQNCRRFDIDLHFIGNLDS